MKRMTFGSKLLILLLMGCLLLTSCNVEISNDNIQEENEATAASVSEIPEYSGEPYVVINNNEPDFSSEDMTEESFENYMELDALGRCQAAYANIGQDIMPTEKRGNISHVKPSGWKSVQYDFVDGKSLYNRCHLIGFQLAGENANEKNLITGTRYLNTQGMLPFENMIADYVKETNNHVLYRVTPLYDGDNLVANGVQMEAKSVEDDGEGILFNIFCYNVQPGVSIDYATGENWESTEKQEEQSSEEGTYILNTNNKKFHKPSCKSVEQMSGQNKEKYTGSRDELIKRGILHAEIVSREDRIPI